MKGDDKAAIDAKAEALAQPAKNWVKWFTRKHKPKPKQAKSAQAEPSSAKKDDDVVDADFEEVKDDKK